MSDECFFRVKFTIQMGPASVEYARRLSAPCVHSALSKTLKLVADDLGYENERDLLSSIDGVEIYKSG